MATFLSLSSRGAFRYVFQSFLVGCLILAGYNLSAQTETEPLRQDRIVKNTCEGYTKPGSTVTVWDWRQEAFEINYYPSNVVLPAHRMANSPFHTYFRNTAHLFPLTGGVRDYEPVDGWELLFHNLGTEDDPVQEPSFGLYNRYDGKMRIFYYIEPDNNKTPEQVLLTFSYANAPDLTGFSISGIFEYFNIPAAVISDFSQNYALQGVTQINEGQGGSSWYLLEWAASYDPCVCVASSLLEVVPILIFRDVLDPETGLVRYDQDRYKSTVFYTPGSFKDRYDLVRYRPIYDNPLGVMAVLSPPRIEKTSVNTTYVENGNEIQEDIEAYRYAGGLKYRINTAAAISNTPVRLLGAIVFTDCANGETRSTPFLDLNCLEEYPMLLTSTTTEIDLGNGSSRSEKELHGCSQPQLEIIAILESTIPGEKEEIIFQARYNTEVVRSTGDIPTNSFAGLTEEEILLTCDPFAVLPVNDREMIKFCENQYDPTISWNEWRDYLRANTERESPVPTASIYPNPFRAGFTLNVPIEWTEQLVGLQLYDALGRVVWAQQTEYPIAGGYTYSEHLGYLSPGAYILQVTGSTFNETFMIQKQ